MNYAKCAVCHGLNSMGFCQYTACRFPETESGVVNASAFVPKIVTNADRIRAMTDEELAGWLERIRLCCVADMCGRSCCYSNKELLDWLRQEAEDA